MSITLDPQIRLYFQAVVDNGASDLHLKTGAQPRVRHNGKLVNLNGQDVLTPEVNNRLIRSTMTEAGYKDYEENFERDYSVTIDGVGRFRVNAYTARGSSNLVARLIPTTPPTAADLNLPPAIPTLSDAKNGIIVVSGATGSGKTTTLAAMIDHINRTTRKHIVTIEDPIEVIHPDLKSSISQREVETDTTSYARALKSALRQDPDVILIGELRTVDTVRTALQAAETGHLVLTTLHTTTAPEAVTRLLDFYPREEQDQIRTVLAESLRGIICQRLLPSTLGGRVATHEILTGEGRVPRAILDPEKGGDLRRIMAEGRAYGMQTFDEDLARLVSEGKIAEETALANAVNAHDLRVVLKRQKAAAAAAGQHTFDY